MLRTPALLRSPSYLVYSMSSRLVVGDGTLVRHRLHAFGSALFCFHLEEQRSRQSFVPGFVSFALLPESLGDGVYRDLDITK